MIAADTSVLVAAFASWHEHHAVARQTLASLRLIGHTLIETYSVLTRLPPPHRAHPHVTADFLKRVTTSLPLLMTPPTAALLPSRLAVLGSTGGAAYDALIAATALEHDAELVSLDARAAQTYRLLGARYRLLA